MALVAGPRFRPTLLGRRSRRSDAEQAPVDGLHVRAGRDPELVAEQDAQALVDAQRLGDIAASLERLHQDPVAGLAVRSQLDEPAPALFGLRQRRPAEAEPRRGETFQPAHANVLEASPPLIEPWAVVTLE